MRIVNLDTVSVVATAGGSEIFTSAQAKAATREGMDSVLINPSVDIVLIDADGQASEIPNFAGTGMGAVVGSVANGPHVCPAGIPTEVAHKGGPLRAISTSGTATVKIAVQETP